MTNITLAPTIILGTDKDDTNGTNGIDDRSKKQLTDVLNDDVIGVIKSFLPPEVLVKLSRSDYIENHSVIKQLIPQCLYDSYIHDMISHDCSFVFTQVLREQFMKFHNWRHFEKGGDRYHSYLTYLRNQCCGFGSVKCTKVIDEMADENGFSANWYKCRGIILSNSVKRARSD